MYLNFYYVNTLECIRLLLSIDFTYTLPFFIWYTRCLDSIYTFDIRISNTYFSEIILSMSDNTIDTLMSYGT